jgi:predicted TIM-barrel fold metal-dependent hydrolase
MHEHSIPLPEPQPPRPTAQPLQGLEHAAQPAPDAGSQRCRGALALLVLVLATVLPRYVVAESGPTRMEPAKISPAAAPAVATTPVADAHLHYKWNQAEVTSPEAAVQALKDNNVRLAVITGTPAERALELEALAPDIVVPIYGVYRRGGDWYGWQGRDGLVEEVRAALASGRYHGIGELHLIGGFAARWNRSDVLKGLLAVAAEYDVPVLVHTEFSRAEPTLSICEARPRNRLVLAHAGAALPPEEVERILVACPNVWMDLSARDPWRFISFPISAEDGRLLPEWEQLVLRWPQRFVIGSDAVWPVDRLDAWDRADTGWEHIGEFLDFHRRWASFLPPDVQRKVLLENALALYGRSDALSRARPDR